MDLTAAPAVPSTLSRPTPAADSAMATTWQEQRKLASRKVDDESRILLARERAAALQAANKKSADRTAPKQGQLLAAPKRLFGFGLRKSNGDKGAATKPTASTGATSESKSKPKQA